MQDRPDQGIKEVMVVDDPDTMRMILSGKYSDILELIDFREMSVSDISQALKINPGSAHYRLKELQRRGLVKMVREETKGNVVKKYYRAAARNIYLDGSKFKALRPGEASPMDGFYDRLIALLAPFGYEIPPDKAGPIKDAMRRYDKRKKELLQQIQDAGVERMEGDRLLVGDAYHVAWLLKEIEDDTLGGIREELRTLLSEIRGPK
ncbi:putative transcriptional regulator (IclR helix-turn-helix domain) [Methanocella conradii HZ254]|uniref:Transcriptional regulator (IclR helix-turn-helix domain) n=1 Tax=Methanocella conradii (strain DSM 24694 / JCM 17849 / CGMCC 1.5162 / HZ254) TaxID=1041930 RepID=H8I689_METCZ|nr:winged helix-turn-helix domain-containing protein [Methanocella conradii]AFD00736.1 putative transcriptional regulator (IclR helix-turn-helix domain) [Methanocella conradii HZ254]MDI6897084.1 winged helix-turn-helix domain-containing protein [Methanocella conradii]